MRRFAEGTEVSIDRSRAEVEALLHRYGATKFMYYRDQDATAIAFEMAGYACKLTVKPPSIDNFKRTETGRQRKATAVQEAYEAEYRRRWRVLILSLKARLESVAAEGETFQEAFAGIMLLRNRHTVAENMALQPELEGIFEAPLMLTNGQ